jgi:hypothetical protein
VAKTEPASGLVFDKIVYDCLELETARGSAESMSINDAKKETGLSEDSILRAISEIRAKGYPVISQKMRPMAEDRFRLAQNEAEYLGWRENLVSSVHGLVALLEVCDRGATARFGSVAKQERFTV